MAGSIVQSWGTENISAGTVLSAAAGADVTTGNWIFLWTNSDTTATVTVTKNAGTATIDLTGTPEKQVVQESGTLEEMHLWVFPITGSGSLTLDVTFGSSQSNRQFWAHEVGGVNAYQGSNSSQDSGSNPTTACTVNVTTQPAFCVMIGNDLQGGTFTVGTGWTNVNTFGSVVHIARLQVKSVSATGNTSGDFGNASFNRQVSAMAVFTEGSAAAQNILAWITA